MTIPKRVLPLLLVAPLLVVFASCVESKHPLSDEKTSKIDDRLIGTWQDENKTTYNVKESAGTKNCLDVRWNEKDKESAGQALIFTTIIKSKSYMSMKDLGDEAQKERKGAYDLYQYRFVDNDTVEVRGMTQAALEKAIAKKLLVVTIDKDKTPTITDSPEGIRHYLEAHADECYPLKTDLMLTFKRQK
jgi:hypothetical protein